MIGLVRATVICATLALGLTAALALAACSPPAKQTPNAAASGTLANGVEPP